MIKVSAPWLTNPSAQKICRLLADAGHQAWFVGGCVRNALLDAPVSDIDLSTDAHPDVVMGIAKAARIKAVPTGIDHGTVTLVVDGKAFEITTFRRDVTTDGRRATVAFSDNMADDARRRDFTMNALYADADGAVVDPLGGMADLRARRVRFIENADLRIKEDYLRILRFFRFYAWYGDPDLGLDADGLAACADNIEGLQSLSAERITAEVLKLFSAPNPAPALAAMAQCGALMQILPGADAGPLAVLIHLEEQTGAKIDPIRRLAVIGGDAEGNLRLSNLQARRLGQITGGESAVEIAYRHGEMAGLDALLVQSASLGQPFTPDAEVAVKHAAAQKLPVNAADLMPAFSGPELGQALKAAEARWIASGFTLTKAELIG